MSYPTLQHPPGPKVDVPPNSCSPDHPRHAPGPMGDVLSLSPLSAMLAKPPFRLWLLSRSCCAAAAAAYCARRPPLGAVGLASGGLSKGEGSRSTGARSGAETKSDKKQSLACMCEGSSG